MTPSSLRAVAVVDAAVVAVAVVVVGVVIIIAGGGGVVILGIVVGVVVANVGDGVIITVCGVVINEFTCITVDAIDTAGDLAYSKIFVKTRLLLFLNLNCAC